MSYFMSDIFLHPSLDRRKNGRSPMEGCETTTEKATKKPFVQKIEEKLTGKACNVFGSSKWILGKKEIVDKLFSKIDECSDKFIQAPCFVHSVYKIDMSFCDLCDCNLPSSQKDKHKLGKKHRKLLKTRFSDINSRLLLENVYLAPENIAAKVDEAERVFVVRCCFDTIPLLQIHHNPWIMDLKAFCADLLFENSLTNNMVLLRFISKITTIIKKELIALILLAYIKSTATAGGMILMSDVRACDSNIDKPWRRTINELLITKGGI